MNKRFVANSGAILASRLINAAIGFILLPFILSRVGDELYGLLALSASFSAISGFAALLDFGFQSSLIVFAARFLASDDHEALSDLISTAAMLYLVIGLLAGLLLFASSSFLVTRLFSISPQYWGLGILIFRIMSVQVILEALGLVPRSLLEAREEFVLTQGLFTLSGIWRSLLTLVVLSLGYGALAIAVLRCMEVLLGYGTMAYAAMRRFPDLRVTPSRFQTALFRELAAFSLPIFGQKINGTVFRQADRLIVGAFLGVAWVARYEIIQSMFRLVVLLQAVSPAAVPATSAALAQGDHDGMHRIALNGTRLALTPSAIVALTAVVLAPFIVEFWVGPQYVVLAPLIRVYLVLAVGAAALAVPATMMTPMGKAGAVMRISIITSLLTSVGSLLTVSRWQLVGIVATTAIAAVVGWVLYLRLFIAQLKLSFWEFSGSIAHVLLVISLCLVPLAVAVQILPPQGLLHVGLYAGVSGLLCTVAIYWLVFSEQERSMLAALLPSALASWLRLS